jgi:transposase-like protein
MALYSRETRGLGIFELGQVKRINEDSYLVASQSGNGTYHVSRVEASWACECLDHKTRGVMCKHIYATIFSTTLREKASSQNFAPEIVANTPVVEKCLVCGSKHIQKWGFRYRKSGARIQRYRCMTCRHRWEINPHTAFTSMRTNPKAIMVALDLYFKGISLRKIQDHLVQFEDTRVSFVAVYKWIQKYVALMEQYAKLLRPQLSNVWHADEMKVNVHGKWQWLWNIMDSDTRYILASHVAQGRGVAEAQEAFQIAKKNSNPEGEPTFLISDGLSSYQAAANREFRNTVHLARVGIQGEVNNNRIERLHGTIRERNKVMRGIKKPNSAIIEGQRIYYNHIRLHMGLKGKTPAEAAGIGLTTEGNRWEPLIERAACATNEASMNHKEDTKEKRLI